MIIDQLQSTATFSPNLLPILRQLKLNIHSLKKPSNRLKLNAKVHPTAISTTNFLNNNGPLELRQKSVLIRSGRRRALSACRESRRDRSHAKTRPGTFRTFPRERPSRDAAAPRAHLNIRGRRSVARAAPPDDRPPIDPAARVPRKFLSSSLADFGLGELRRARARIIHRRGGGSRA